MMHSWKSDARCLGKDTNLFFDKYEEDKQIAKKVDTFCQSCKMNRMCFSTGFSGKEWGVWGGIYLKDGKIDKEQNSHKTKEDWSNTWESLTTEIN
jgi:hypothetical protein